MTTNTGAGRGEKTAEIVKLLRANSGATGIRAVFTDFCALSAIALRNQADPVGFQSREDEYEQLRARYTTEQMSRFAEVLGLVAIELTTEPRDVLGDVFMRLEAGDRGMGQFFTPYPVSLLIASVSLADALQLLETRPFITLSEPSCGAGGMVIAATQVLEQHGIDYRRRLHVTADDISPLAVHMTYVQLSILGVAALVNRRNTLSMELFEVWPTPAHIQGDWTVRLAA